MYKYKLSSTYEIIDLEIKIETAKLDKKGIGDILSIDLKYHYKLGRAKDRINDINYIQWDKIKKISNPYEFIHTFNKNTFQNDDRSVAIIKPLSRSFFKMIEIIYEFCPHIQNKNANKNANKNTNKNISTINASNTNISNTNTSNPQRIVSVHIAEGPGGFIEAIRYIRKDQKDDHAFGMTLVKYNKDEYKNVNVLGWNKSSHFLFKNPEVCIVNGMDGTGNIYKTENIEYLNNEMKSISPDGADIITADGGFDFGIEYNFQEQLSCKLIFSQIICALKCQKVSGTFICKFFDTNLYFTTEMLYLLYTVYETVYIYKPLTSRVANSEKYIICTNFKGIDEILLDSLFTILDNWNKYNDQTINHIFAKIPSIFIDKMKEINAEIIDRQINSINSTLDIIKKNLLDDNKWYNSIILLHLQNARDWCKKYNIPYIL